MAPSNARTIGDQEIAGSIRAGSGNILSWKMIVNYFLRSLSTFRWFKTGSYQFLAKECAQELVKRLENKPVKEKCG